jgi:hypothetical protein
MGSGNPLIQCWSSTSWQSAPWSPAALCCCKTQDIHATPCQRQAQGEADRTPESQVQCGVARCFSKRKHCAPQGGEARLGQVDPEAMQAPTYHERPDLLDERDLGTRHRALSGQQTKGCVFFFVCFFPLSAHRYTSTMSAQYGFGTNAVHAGQDPDNFPSSAVVMPISMSTTFKQSAPGVHKVCSFVCGLPRRAASWQLRHWLWPEV